MRLGKGKAAHDGKWAQYNGFKNKEWRALANSTVCVIDFDRNQSGALIV
jgi:hypothetical protein